MARLNGHELQFGAYDTERYPFQPELTRAAYERYMPFDWEARQPDLLENLHKLHTWLGKVGVEASYPLTVNTRETDQKAQYYNDLYLMALHKMRPGFRSSYLDFMEDEVQPLFDEPVVFQTVPTFRVHTPGNIAVGEYHTDAKYGHPEEAVNFWVPVTNANGSNSLHVQTSEDTEPRPIDIKYGEFVIFDGVRLPHGNEINETAKTRVSFDFRVIPESQFKPSDKASINTGLAFKIGEGGYYSLLTEDYLVSQRGKIEIESAPAREWEARIKADWAKNRWDPSEHTLVERMKRIARVIFLAKS